MMSHLNALLTGTANLKQQQQQHLFIPKEKKKDKITVIHNSKKDRSLSGSSGSLLLLRLFQSYMLISYEILSFSFELNLFFCK